MKIGDFLYRYNYNGFCVGVEKYKIYEIRQQETDAQYGVECLHCDHGWNCKLLVGKDDYGNFIYIQMLNDKEDSYESQKYHHNHEAKFWKTEKEAKIEYYKKSLVKIKESVENSKKSLEKLQKDCALVESLVKDLTEN